MFVCRPGGGHVLVNVLKAVIFCKVIVNAGVDNTACRCSHAGSSHEDGKAGEESHTFVKSSCKYSVFKSWNLMGWFKWLI